MTIDVAVLGASGYTGLELLRYLNAHPAMRACYLGAHTSAGEPVSKVAPHLNSDAVFADLDPSNIPDSVELVFMALPHGTSSEMGKSLSAAGRKVVDLSADHRLDDSALYESTYGVEHAAPDALAEWTYGLTEINRGALGDLIANPGCYPTSVLLPLIPLARAGLITATGTVAHSISGVSGAGRKSDSAFSYSELEGSVTAYGVGNHRHRPEMEQELSKAFGEPVSIVFTPHLAPMVRGMLSTIHVHGDADRCREALQDAYSSEPFVHVVDRQPATRWCSGTNHAFIAVAADGNGTTLTCAIDNLGKGAAGQAIQNANVICGLNETDGLDVFTAVTP